MSLTFQFHILTLNPSTYRCELFHAPPYTDREMRGNIKPVQTASLTAANGAHTVTFTKDPGKGYALRLRDASGAVIARSNSRTLSSKRNLMVIQTVISKSEAEFASFAPPVPFKDDKTTFDQLILEYAGKDMRLRGHALHDGVINKRFGFLYTFRIKPVDVPVWVPLDKLPKDETPEDTLTIDTTGLQIDADRNRQELLMGILNPIIRRRLRHAFQRGFHESIVKQAAQSNIHPVVTVTSAEVVKSESLDLKVGILADAPG